MYLTHNEGKYVRTLKNRTYTYISSISINVYIHKLNDTTDEYNNT